MAATLWAVGAALPGFFSGGVGHRLIGVGALVGSGLAVYFPMVWLIGGMDKDDINALLRRRGKKGSDSV
jgi:putative peptidoglycan lipid II flippase